jgi:hypothetical protein
VAGVPACHQCYVLKKLSTFILLLNRDTPLGARRADVVRIAGESGR